MKQNKRLKFIKNKDGVDFYLFKPSIFRIYLKEKKGREQPSHRYSLSHKLHMLIYVLFGGYRILYCFKNGEIVSYIIYIKSNNKIIKKCEKNDYYTIFLWTFPEYRGQGLATKMADFMLHDLGIEYNHFYKTISKDNIASIRVAEKSGFVVKCDSVKSKILHTISQVKKGDQYLYWYTA